MKSIRATSRTITLARLRARRRQRSAGAALFIVAITLGLLAVMGVYGLTSTSQDVRAAGNIRQAMQTQHVAESGLVLTSQTFTPGVSGEIMRLMHAPPGVAQARASATECKTAKPYSIADPVLAANYRNAEACKVLEWQEMQRIAQNVNAWNAGQQPATLTGATNLRSFGEVSLWPIVRVELTNPDYWDVKANNSQNLPFTYAEVRVTVFVDMKPNRGDLPTSQADPKTISVAVGRGRLVVGPYFN
jgi:hypothetical protein